NSLGELSTASIENVVAEPGVKPVALPVHEVVDLFACRLLGKLGSKPRIEFQIEHEVHAIDRTAIVHTMRAREVAIPELAGSHHDALAVRNELDVRMRHDRNRKAHLTQGPAVFWIVVSGDVR